MNENAGFGAPVEGAVETEEQRIARLRAQATQIAAQQSDAEMLAAFVIEEKAKKREEVLPTDLSGWPADYDKVEIYEDQDVNALPWVPLGLNGYTLRAPRGREIILPHVYVTECLEHAVSSTCTQSAGGLIIRDRRRFPFQFKGKATPTEYKDFMAGERALAAQQLQTMAMAA
jgi:hypothetical protein